MSFSPGYSGFIGNLRNGIYLIHKDARRSLFDHQVPATQLVIAQVNEPIYTAPSNRSLSLYEDLIVSIKAADLQSLKVLLKLRSFDELQSAELEKVLRVARNNAQFSFYRFGSKFIISLFTYSRSLYSVISGISADI